MRVTIENYDEYRSLIEALQNSIQKLDFWTEQQKPRHPGFCKGCDKFTQIYIHEYCSFGKNINLRETCECDCGLNQRARLLWTELTNHVEEGGSIALFEAGTPIQRRLESKYLVSSSLYLGEDFIGGASYSDENCDDRMHQDITRLSYKTESFDAVVHNDVLEHVPNYIAALNECFRVLKSGGALIFTCLFLERTLKQLLGP